MGNIYFSIFGIKKDKKLKKAKAREEKAIKTFSFKKQRVLNEKDNLLDLLPLFFTHPRSQSRAGVGGGIVISMKIKQKGTAQRKIKVK